MATDQIPAQLRETGQSIINALEKAYERVAPAMERAFRYAWPKLRFALRILMFATPVVLTLSLIREYYPFPSAPRFQPGSNVVVVKQSAGAEVYGEDFRIELTALKSERQESPVSADFRLAGSRNSCMFAGIPQGAAAFYMGLHPVKVSFLGSWDGLARFDVRRLEKVHDASLRIGRDDSASVPGTDLTISVVDLSAGANAPGGSPGNLAVTYVAQTPAGKNRQESKSPGDVVRIDNMFDIRVKSVSRAGAEFDVRAAEDPGSSLPRGVCTTAGQ